MKKNCMLCKIIRRFAWEVFRVFPINRNKIILSSYYGSGYSDNLKYIANEMLNSCDYQLVWVVKGESEAATLPKGITPCVKDSLNYIYHLSTSAIWIDNCRKDFRYKKKKQLYIQTYHGGAAGKKCERDVESKLGKAYVDMSIKDGAATDLMISSDGFMTNLYHTSFWYNGPVAEIGYPRYDILFKDDHFEEIEKVRKFFNLEKNVGFILYAPTFRYDLNFDVYDVDYRGVLRACKKTFNKDFVVLVHLHPNVATKFDQLHYNENVINATVYPDMQELMAASDVLLGDYSSVNLEFALMRKPVFRFAVDIEEYRNDRDMYYEMDEYPYTLADNNEQLIKDIEEFNEQQYLEKLEKFFIRVGAVFNSHAAKDCVALIDDYYKFGMSKEKFFEEHKKDFK